MVAFYPQYRHEDDTRNYGAGRFLTDEEIGDVVEYVLKISGQQADAAKAARGDVLFHDGTKGNCNDCHENERRWQSRARVDESDPAASCIFTALTGQRSSNPSSAAGAARCPHSTAS